MEWSPGPLRLSLSEREEISRGLVAGQTLRKIACQLGRAPSTVSREVKTNGGRSHYRAAGAHQGAYERARPKMPKLVTGPLTSKVESWLGQWRSPQEIANRLRLEHPGDSAMWVNHETIYQSVFVQGWGELRRELHRCLRTDRARRRPKGMAENRGRIPKLVMISERPAKAKDRAVPGHWEKDLILGKNGHSAVEALVERSTRYLMLLHLPEGREAEKLDQAMRQAITTLPDEVVRSIAWDQGKELTARELHCRHRRSGLLLRPLQYLAAGIEREHQRALTSVHAQGHGSIGAHCRGPGSYRRQPQQPPSQDTWIHETIRETRRACCNDRLNPPCKSAPWCRPGAPPPVPGSTNGLAPGES